MRRSDAWLGASLLVSLAASAYHLDWGLPQDNDSWAADALGPITALGVVARSFGTWNSGWFYFKYPLAYPLELTASFAPYLAYLFLTGQWTHPTATYPYGFSHPEEALFILALIGRALNVAFAVGTVALAFGIARRLFGCWTARLSAWLVATCYPVAYYAHTTNLDVGYLFWLMLALYCAVIASESRGSRAWAGLGVAAAMAVSTKEQGFAFLLPLPFVALALRASAERSVRVWWGSSARIMVGAGIITGLLANNVLWNPMGFIGRLAYLVGQPLQAVQARLAPVEFSWFKGDREWFYASQLWNALDSGLGTPVVWLGLAGAMLLSLRLKVALWLLLPAVVHYYVSLRGLELIALRYTLPLMVIGAIFAAAFLAETFRRWRRGPLRIACYLCAAAVMALGLARVIELNWLLRTDPRYQAEAWIAAQVAPGARGEVYQKAVYLPRFGASVKVARVPMGERSESALQRRRPDFIVLSSASHKSITHRWNPDWRVTRELLTPVPPAQAMLKFIEGKRGAYALAAVFEQSPRWIQPGITSLSPRIEIYVRDES